MTERIGPSCAVAFIKKHQKLNLGKILSNKGKKIKQIWAASAQKSNIKIKISGIDPLATFKLLIPNWSWYNFFIQEMLKKNFLASDRCYANYKHDEKSLLKYEKACSEIFSEISYLNRKNNLKKG